VGPAGFFPLRATAGAVPNLQGEVERLPWAVGKSHLTITYAWFLAAWCKRLSWKEVAQAFTTSWDTVFRAVKMAVAWGLEHRDLSGITAIGTDEICWRKRKDKFVTLVYQLDQGKRRLLWIGPDRTAKTFQGFFDWLGRNGADSCGLSAATCGNRIWPLLPKRPRVL
jgi:Transposase and inactivated derivatives